jgi:ribokinase
VDPTDPRGWRLGGTVTYAAIAAANLGVHVRALVGADAESERAPELDTLRSAGVEVATVRLRNAPIFKNRHSAEGRVQFALGASDAIPVSALPGEWRAADGALLGPVAGELGDEWAAAFPAATVVGLAAQGLVRQLVPGRVVESVPLLRSAILDRADAVLISAEDVAGHPTNLSPIVAHGKRFVVSHGDRGALLLHRENQRTVGRYLPPTPRREAIDTVGAGDTFLAAWMAAKLLMPVAEEWRSLLIASVMASLSVQRARLEDAPTRGDVCDVLFRLRDRHSD